MLLDTPGSGGDFVVSVLPFSLSFLSVFKLPVCVPHPEFQFAFHGTFVGQSVGVSSAFPLLRRMYKDKVCTRTGVEMQDFVKMSYVSSVFSEGRRVCELLSWFLKVSCQGGGVLCSMSPCSEYQH